MEVGTSVGLAVGLGVAFLVGAGKLYEEVLLEDCGVGVAWAERTLKLESFLIKSIESCSPLLWEGFLEAIVLKKKSEPITANTKTADKEMVSLSTVLIYDIFEILTSN